MTESDDSKVDALIEDLESTLSDLKEAADDDDSLASSIPGLEGAVESAEDELTDYQGDRSADDEDDEDADDEDDDDSDDDEQGANEDGDDEDSDADADDEDDPDEDPGEDHDADPDDPDDPDDETAASGHASRAAGGVEEASAGSDADADSDADGDESRDPDDFAWPAGGDAAAEDEED